MITDAERIVIDALADIGLDQPGVDDARHIFEALARAGFHVLPPFDKHPQESA